MKNGQRNGQKNGHRNGKVRVAIVGVGNCASSLVQGVHYYREEAQLPTPTMATRTLPLR